MIKKPSIFLNKNIIPFILQLYKEDEFLLKNLEDLDTPSKNDTEGIIIINKKDFSLISRLSLLTNQYIVLVNFDTHNIKPKENLKIIQTPLSINSIKNYIKEFLSNSTVKFHNIIISNKKLTNTKNNRFCYLTDVESSILFSLFKNKLITKDYIKKEILNFKKEIETNSIESHLSRIRKKITQIEISVKIQSKNKYVSISID